MRCLALVLSLLAAPAVAQTCPEVPDRASELASLFTEAQAAATPADGQAIGNAMWEIWADAPDDHAQELLDEGMERRASYDFDGAVKAFDALVAYCPDYAEGYNQRAFVAYMRQDFAAALADLDRALERLPLHVAALSGKALTLMGLGRDTEAQAVLRRAVTLNPWLPERGLLREVEDDTL